MNYTANGRVGVGFSDPVVALYNNSGGTVTYTGGRPLARGVKVSLSVNGSDDNIFYADDAEAESEAGKFSGGTAGLTVDGLHPESERMISGLPEPEAITYGENQTVKVVKHGENAAPPYLGIGFIRQYRCGGQDIFVPIILTKAKFRSTGLDASTREKDVNWQTQELTADLHRDDTVSHDWRWVCEDQTTREAARKVLHGLLNATEVTA